MKIIGVSGRKRHGKDETFKAINAFVPNSRRIAFADPLYAELAAATGMSIDHIKANKEKFRLALQWWGTDFRRYMFGHNYWVEQAARRLDSVCNLEKPAVIVFTDVRFPNEAELIKSRGGELWRVVRTNAPLMGDDHVSETELDGWPFDFTLRHDSIEQLHDQVERRFARMISC